MESRETSRQRFIRNGEESARIVRAAQKRAEQEGDFEKAREIGEIQDKWDGMLQFARDLEARDTAAGNN